MTDQNFSGRKLGDFEVRQLLGEGGMGAVYRAVDVRLNRSVAIKVLHPHMSRKEQFRQRFAQEARSIAALDHPNIIRVYTFSSDNGGALYLAMELVETGSLRRYIQHLSTERQAMPITEALLLIRQIASALHYAHRQGMVHRDIKPGNVLLKLSTASGTADTQFSALLTDFGLVKLAEGGVETQGDGAMGTMPYMAPEQFKGEYDARTDLYALGVMLYELCTGQLPFKPKNMAEAAQMHLDQSPTPPKSLRGAISNKLQRVIARAIAKDPEKRYQNGQQFIRALLDVENDDEYQATVVEEPEQQALPEASLIAYLESLPGAQNIEPPTAPSNLTVDRIVAQRKNEPPQYFSLDQLPAVVGRAETADFRLDDDSVALRHSRITRQNTRRYTVTALSSEHQTFIDGVALLPNVPETWSGDQRVTVGDYQLSFQFAEDTIGDRGIGGGTTERAREQDKQSTPAATQPAATLTLEPKRVELEAGEQSQFQITLSNQSRTVRHFSLQIDGVPREWYTLPTTSVRLMPDETKTTTLQIRTPRATTTTAGDYTLTLTADDNDERDRQSVSANVALTIQPFYGFAVDMLPTRITKDRLVQFTIENNGNAPDTYGLVGRDAEDTLKFEFDPPRITVEPGTTETVMFRVNPRNNPPWVGQPEMYPLEVTAEAASGGEKQVHGQRVVEPRLPSWIIAPLTLVCVALIGGAVLFGGELGNGDDSDDSTQVEVIATATSTSIPSDTPEPTNTPTDAPTATPTDEPTNTLTATSTATETTESTSTPTPTTSPTATTQPTVTPTSTVTAVAVIPPIQRDCNYTVSTRDAPAPLTGRLFIDSVSARTAMVQSTADIYSDLGFVSEIAVSDNGSFIAAVGSGLAVYDFEAFSASDRRATQLSGFSSPRHSNDLTDAVFSPDSNIVATSDADGQILVWSTRGGSSIAQYRADEWVTSMDYTNFGEVLAAGSTDGRVYFWNTRLTTDEPCAILDVTTFSGAESGIQDLKFLPQDNQMVILQRNGSVTIWDLTTSFQVATLPSHSPESRGVSTCTQSTSDEAVYAYAVDISPDGEFVATVGRDGYLNITSLNNLNDRLCFQVVTDDGSTSMNEALLLAVGFGRNSDVVAFGGRSGLVFFYNLETLLQFRGNPGRGVFLSSIRVLDRVLTLDFDPSQGVLIAGGTAANGETWKILQP